ncbi:MFS transporter [Nesterenkonia sp. LB17]|uniref:MFS transporter n=1 Tax=unclassified Nesterenkonia TaxID=2629769 RepID=UPI001F4D29B5|nr:MULTISPECIES: MFS transporter [unclassified Nesterenkonia]MCH8559222.1 MFS transporter [Nesterenkonia sp. DZ6]MCH8565051.1 MFS transporter [Nesterenkonia sp. LB17]MCH8571568.1 MFS transporter [Nesterenkonia sp. AY15]
MSAAPASPPGRHPQLLMIVTVLIVAANLRPAITAVGPLIERIGEDTGLGPAALGLLGAIPALGFGVVALFVAALGRRWGLERTIFVSLLLLGLGTLLRSLPLGAFSLFAGTVILSAAIGVGNVLVPAVVKRDFPARVPVMTGLYTAVLVGCAAVASGTAVPLAAAKGWEFTLGVTAVFALVSAALWGVRFKDPRAGRAESAPTPAGADLAASEVSASEASAPEVPALGAAPAPGSAGGTMWHSAVAWQVTAYFALQSGIFYLMLTWFPAIQTSHGVTEAAAGFWLGAYQAIGIVASLVVGPIMQRAQDQRAVVVALAGIMLVGVLGILFLPEAMPAWALIVGFASGGNLLAGLTLISMRARTSGEASRLSGMAQGVGYLLAAVGPLLAGTLFELTGSWSPVLWIIVAAIVVMAVVGLFAGRRVDVL